MFYVDYMAGFEDYIERVNTQKKIDPKVTWLAKDRCLHAARCLLYLRYRHAALLDCTVQDSTRWSKPNHPIVLSVTRLLLHLPLNCP